jgi:flagellar hook-length control protein FliK
MTTTTHASTAAPKPVETANKPAQANARANADKPAEADLFASLLSLVSDTHLAPAATPPQDAETATATDGDAPADDKTGNPLAALLAWAMPAASAPTAAAPTGTGSNATDTKTATAAPTPTAALGIDKALADTGVNIDGMTRVDEAAPAPTVAALARAAAASRPAFSPLHTASTLAPQRAGDATAPYGGAPAMVWQRGAVSGTEALQQQHTDQHAQVRSTVALNERFGFSGAAELGAPPPLREFGGIATSPGSPAALGAGLDASQTVNGAAGADSASGDAARDGQTEQALGDAQAFADASAEAEGPTVSHWGTQHMRHASLRVGGEGSEAIDIQLSVKGQEVQVAFQTDSAEARASLRENAGQSLGDLLQRSGIQLGGVSVGGQGQAQGGGSQQPRAGGLSTEALGRTHAAAEPTSRPAPQPRSDGSRPLDVFA